MSIIISAMSGILLVKCPLYFLLNAVIMETALCRAHFRSCGLFWCVYVCASVCLYVCVLIDVHIGYIHMEIHAIYCVLAFTDLLQSLCANTHLSGISRLAVMY